MKNHSEYHSQWGKTDSLPIEKQEIKVFKLAKKSNSLITDDMILYMENPKDSTPKLLELIQQFSNVAGYKINVQKSVAFLYTNNENIEREIRELIPFNSNKNHKMPGNKPGLLNH